jgi:hypothetical protein
VWIIAEEVGITLESLDQKTRDFVIQIALPQWFSKNTHQVFGEVTMRIQNVLRSNFYRRSRCGS